jgi:Tape measure protein
MSGEETVASLGFAVNSDSMEQARARAVELEKAAKQLGTTTDELNKKMAAATSGIAANAGVSEKLDAIVSKTGVSYAAANAYLAQSVAAHANVTKEVEAHSSAITGLSTNIGGLLPSLSKLSLGFVGIAAAGAGALVDLAKIADQVDRTKRTFDALTGSQAQGARVFDAVKAAAAASGGSINTIAAAAENAALGMDKFRDKNVIFADTGDKTAKSAIAMAGAFGTLNQAMETNHATADDESKVFAALSQSIDASGTITLQAFQKIIGISLPTAKAISDAFGSKNITEFQEQLAKTPIPAQQFIDVMNKIAPLVQQAFDTRGPASFEQSMRGVTTEWENLLKTIAASGAGDLLTKALGGIKDQIPIEKAALQEMARDFTALGQNITGFVDGVITDFGKLGAVAVSTAQTVGGAVASIAGAVARGTSNPGNVPASGNPMGDFGGGDSSGIAIGADLPGFASGTDSAPGGLARINEQGGEIVNLPSGSQVIPHDISTQMASAAGAIQGLTTIQGQPVVSATPDQASIASIKQITDAISQSTIDISKNVIASSNNIVSALNKLAGGGTSPTTNPATGLPIASSTSSTSTSSTPINPFTGQPYASGGGGGGGFTLKNSASDEAKAKAIATAQAAANKTVLGDNANFPGAIGGGFGSTVRGSSSAVNGVQGYFPAGAPTFNGQSVGSFNFGSDLNSALNDFDAGLNPAMYSSTVSATGSTVFGANSGGSNYSSDYGGNSISGITGNDPNTINYGGGSVDMGYFAKGGGFIVGGVDGIDKNFIGIHVTKGEEVEIKPPGGVSVPDSVAMPAAFSGPPPAADPSPQSSTTTTNKIVNIQVQAGIQADSFLRSRAQIARGI